ncbi:MAG: hypothetical protein MAG453_01464 [Calditrichaeota bacterium]|nr:hypothetical protein [Calditrichota bacterium]
MPRCRKPVLCWLVALLLVAALFGCEESELGGGVVLSPDLFEPPETVDPGVLRATFDSVWAKVNDSYAHIDKAPVSWEQMRDTYRPRIDAISSTDSFRGLLLEMLGELADENIALIDSAGELHPAFTREPDVNWREPEWFNSMDEFQWSDRGDWGIASEETFGYLFFRKFNPATFDRGEFDAVLDTLRNKQGILIDVRMNGHPVRPLTYPAVTATGDLILSSDVIRRFLNNRQDLLFPRARAGTFYEEELPDTLSLNPRGTWQFDQRVAVLTGEGTSNAGELFAAAMGVLENVTVLGDHTAGSVGVTEQFPIGGGWSVTFPVVTFDRIDESAIQGAGLDPDVELPWSSTSFANGTDGVLLDALNWLSGQSGPE